MTLSFSGSTDIGRKRKSNEDTFLIDEQLRLAIVCDGVSGNVCGKLASDTCAQTVLEFVKSRASVIEGYNSDPSPRNRAKVAGLLQAAIQAASAKIVSLTEADASRKGMSTTAEVLLLLKDYIVLAHVGDSRTYVVRAGMAHQLTEDHKVSAEMVRKGLWTLDEAAKSPYANVLTRAVGSQKFVEVDLLQAELTPGDCFVICSDGLSDYLRSAELPDLAEKTPGPALVPHLIQLANERGGGDNITVVSVRLEKTANAEKTDALDVLKKSDIIRKVSLFRYLTYSQLLKLLNLVTLKNYKTGELLVEEGSAAEEMYVVATGGVDILKGGHVITHRKNGDMIGEMGLFDKAPRSASVKCTETTSVLAIGRKDLLDLFRQEPQIAVKFLWSMTQELNHRLRVTTQELAEVKTTLMSARTDLPFPVAED